MNKVAVFQDLGIKETLLVIFLRAAIGGIHIGDCRKTGVGASGSVDGNEGVPYPITVL